MVFNYKREIRLHFETQQASKQKQRSINTDSPDVFIMTYTPPVNLVSALVALCVLFVVVDAAILPAEPAATARQCTDPE